MEYSVRMPPTVGAIAGGVWFIIGLVFVWGILGEKAWSARWLPISAVGYLFWYWIERLIWNQPRPNAPFAIAVQLILLILVYFASKSMSREAYERNSENPATE